MDPNRWANKSRMFGASVYHAEPTVASGDDLHLITVNDPKIRCSVPFRPHTAIQTVLRLPWRDRLEGTSCGETRLTWCAVEFDGALDGPTIARMSEYPRTPIANPAARRHGTGARPEPMD